MEMSNLFGFNFYRNPYYSAVFNQMAMKPEWFIDKGMEAIEQKVLKSLVIYASQECKVCYVCARLKEGDLMVIECIDYPAAYSPYDVEAMILDRVIVNTILQVIEQKDQVNVSPYQTAYSQLVDEGLIGYLAGSSGTGA